MRRPWNAVDFPVYSLATKSDDMANMNICTYVSPISMQPKLYAIAIYENTKTLENAINSDKAVLQFLSHSQKKWVNLLGKKSGFKIDKISKIQQFDAIETWNGFDVLTNCFALLLLQKKSYSQQGDHHLFIYEGIQTKNMQKESPLMFQTLIDEKIIL